MSVREKNPGAPLGRILFYCVAVTIVRVFFRLFYGTKSLGKELVPKAGPVLLVPNHQSHFDPVVAGMSVYGRQTNFLARSTLFGHKWFAALIENLNAVPLKQGTPDTQAMRAALEQLAQGRVVLIFPEGSRTPDGAMHPFKRGTWLLLSRSKATVVPCAIEGAYDAFRRGQKFPSLRGRKIMVKMGRPIPASELLPMGAERGLEHLRRTIEALRVELAAEMKREGVVLTTKPASSVELDDDGWVPPNPEARA